MQYVSLSRASAAATKVFPYAGARVENNGFLRHQALHADLVRWRLAPEVGEHSLRALHNCMMRASTAACQGCNVHRPSFRVASSGGAQPRKRPSRWQSRWSHA